MSTNTIKLISNNWKFISRVKRHACFLLFCSGRCTLGVTLDLDWIISTINCFLGGRERSPRGFQRILQHPSEREIFLGRSGKRNHDSNYQIASCFLFTKSLFYNFLFTRYITTKSKIQIKSWISQIKYKVLNEYEAHIKDIKYEDEYEYGKMMIKLRSHNIAKWVVNKCLFVDQTGSYPMFNMFIEFGCVLVFRNWMLM